MTVLNDTDLVCCVVLRCGDACCVACCSVRRLSVEQLIAEDAALEKSCTDALSFVRTCEQLRGYNKQVQPNTVSTMHIGYPYA